MLVNLIQKLVIFCENAMSKRIRELAEQATQEFSPAFDRDKWQDKFAELIVRECATHLHRRGIQGFGILEERNLKEHLELNRDQSRIDQYFEKGQ